MGGSISRTGVGSRVFPAQGLPFAHAAPYGTTRASLFIVALALIVAQRRHRAR